MRYEPLSVKRADWCFKRTTPALQRRKNQPKRGSSRTSDAAPRSSPWPRRSPRNIHEAPHGGAATRRRNIRRRRGRRPQVRKRTRRRQEQRRADEEEKACEALRASLNDVANQLDPGATGPLASRGIDELPDHGSPAKVAPEGMHRKKSIEEITEEIHRWDYQRLTKLFYEDQTSQMLVAAAIIANFLTNIVEKQIWPSSDRGVGNGQIYAERFRACELFFNIFFTVELAVNLYCHTIPEFWRDGWNVFDFVMVVISWVIESGLLPPQLAFLRLVRALRVFRLFKRVKQLRKILEAIGKAIPGVSYAFLIMLLVMCIYAIVAVDFLQNKGTDGRLDFEWCRSAEKIGRSGRALVPWFNTTSERWETAVQDACPPYYTDRNEELGPRAASVSRRRGDAAGTRPRGPRRRRHGERAAAATPGVDAGSAPRRRPDAGSAPRRRFASAPTPRRRRVGNEYFGNFLKALYTMFQVLTGDSWSEAIGRPLLQNWGPWGTSVFFVSFYLGNAPGGNQTVPSFSCS